MNTLFLFLLVSFVCGLKYRRDPYVAYRLVDGREPNSFSKLFKSSPVEKVKGKGAVSTRGSNDDTRGDSLELDEGPDLDDTRGANTVLEEEDNLVEVRGQNTGLDDSRGNGLELEEEDNLVEEVILEKDSNVLTEDDDALLEPIDDALTEDFLAEVQDLMARKDVIDMADMDEMTMQEMDMPVEVTIEEAFLDPESVSADVDEPGRGDEVPPETPTDRQKQHYNRPPNGGGSQPIFEDPNDTEMRKLRERAERIDNLQQSYGQKTETQRTDAKRKFEAFKNEWDKIKPKEFIPPSAYFPVMPVCAPCNCGQAAAPVPSARSLEPEVEIADYETESRYYRPIKSERRKKRQVDSYWYDDGAPNYTLERINSGLKAARNYAPEALKYARPLHFGKISTDQKYPSKRKFGHSADFNFPQDSRAFAKKPTYGKY